MTDCSTSGLRRQNRDAVLRMIAREAPVSRTEISKETGLTGAAVSRITRELIDMRLAVEVPSHPVKGKVGRRNIHLDLDAGGAFVLGIALTANVRSVTIGNSRGEVIARRDLPMLEKTDPSYAIAQIHRVAQELINDVSFETSRLMGCAVSIAGIADPDTGIIVRSELFGWSDVPMGAELEARLSLPVRVEGRAPALLRAEMWSGQASGMENVVLLNNAIFFGAAVLIDGRIMRGQANLAGQFGHMKVPGNDTPCACGRTGCLNAVASGSSVLRRLADLNDSGLDRLLPGDRLRELSSRRDGPKDGEIRQAFREAGLQMGYAVDNILSILNPELLLLAGNTGRHPDFLSGVEERLRELRPNESSWPVKASMVTSDESVIWLGLESYVFSSSLDIEQLRVA